jgi:hypothetical protein
MNSLILKTLGKCFLGSMLVAFLFFGGKIFYYSHWSTESWNWLLVLLVFLISFPSKIALITNYPIVLTFYATLALTTICFEFKIFPQTSEKEKENQRICKKYKLELTKLLKIQKAFFKISLFSFYLLIFGGIGVFVATAVMGMSSYSDVSDWMENDSIKTESVNKPSCEMLALDKDFNGTNEIVIKSINGENIEKLSNKDRVTKCRYFYSNDVELIDSKYVK